MPIKVPCGCGKTLSVPDSSVGKSVTCPSCKRSVLIAHPDAPTTSTPDQSYRPQPAAPKQLCPRCSAAMQPEAIMCTVCGFDTQSGRFVVGDLGARTTFNVKAYVGPVVALVVLAVGGWFVYSVVSKSSATSGDEIAGKTGHSAKNLRTTPRSGGNQTAEQNVEVGIDRSPSTRLFAGGTVDSVISLSDTLKPYDLKTSISVLPGGLLAIEQGVVLTGAEGVTITVAGGDFLVRGVLGHPAVIGVPVAAVGPGGDFTASYAVFASTPTLTDVRLMAIEHATFSAGIRLEPKPPESITEWKIDSCDFYPMQTEADPCLEVRNEVPRRLLTLRLRRGNFLGKVTGVVRATAAMDLTRSYWEGGPEGALESLTAEGQVAYEPISSHRVHEAGGCSPTDLRALLSPLGAKMIPVARERVLHNTGLGFEVEFPEGWKMAGDSMLVPPSKYSRARVRFEWQRGEKLTVRLRSRWVMDLQKSGITDLDATQGEPVTVHGVDGLDFTCTFAAGGQRWANRVVVLPSATGSYSISLYAREDHMKALAADFLKIVERFTPLGER
jgi:hypothetical protein